MRKINYAGYRFPPEIIRQAIYSGSPSACATSRICRERTRGIGEEAGMLVRELGPDAYSVARLMRRKAKSADERKYWRDVAMAVARIAGKRIDTEARMAAVADFGDGREPRNAGTRAAKGRSDRRAETARRRARGRAHTALATPSLSRASTSSQTAKFRLTEQRDFRALRRRGILGQATGSTHEHS